MSLIHEMLRKRPTEAVITDGSKGVLSFDEMQRRGLTHADDLARVAPEFVRSVHLRYLYAGADVFQTFTFGLNGRNRAEDGVFPDPFDIFERNKEAVSLAVQARGRRNALVAASIGPLLGEMLEKPHPSKPRAAFFPYRNALALYETQMQGCIAGGADVLNVETVNDPISTVVALHAARRANAYMNARVPIVLTMNIDSIRKKATWPAPSWSTPHGVRVSDLVTYTNEHPEVVAVGANCGNGFDKADDLARAFVAARPRSIVWMKMNAGKPHMDANDHAIYDMATRDHAASYARSVYDAGARAIGGCCGTTPDLINAMAKELSS